MFTTGYFWINIRSLNSVLVRNGLWKLTICVYHWYIIIVKSQNLGYQLKDYPVIYASTETRTGLWLLAAELSIVCRSGYAIFLLMGMILNKVDNINFPKAIWLFMLDFRGSIELSYNSRGAKRIAFIGHISGFSVVLCIAL